MTIIIPVHEEEWIDRTIMSCIDQDYPIESLEVIVVDDCSTDGSVNKIGIRLIACMKNAAVIKHSTGQLRCPGTKPGKKTRTARGTYLAKHNLIAFVDSDSFLEPDAIRNLVQRFRIPKWAASAAERMLPTRLQTA